MRDAFVLRQTADYDARPDVDASEVRRLIAGGREFLQAALVQESTVRALEDVLK